MARLRRRDRRIGCLNVSLGQHLFNVPFAQSEAEVQPYTLLRYSIESRRRRYRLLAVLINLRFSHP
jgi:hypothetical protein